MNRPLIVVLVGLASVVATACPDGHRLWYRAPATDSLVGWERESIPIGCGWFGVNVFGGVTNGRYQVTQNTVLSNQEGDGRPNMTDALEVILQTDHARPTGYSRGLDLATATAWTEYEQDGVRYRRETMASYPAKAMAIRLTASKTGALDFAIAAEAPFLHPFGQVVGKHGVVGRTAKVTVSGNDIDVFQRLERYAINFDSRLRVVTDGRVEPTVVRWTHTERVSEKQTFSSKLVGDTAVELSGLKISGATEATVYFACDTNYRLSTRCFTAEEGRKLDPIDPSPEVKRLVDAASAKGYEAFAAEHRKDVAGMLGRVTVDLGGDAADARVPTDELLSAYAGGKRSVYLEETYFQFGRYLLVSSSRPGTMPANLQGVWNAHRYSPWGCGYWHNINVQMNYWPAFSCNLAECFEAYAAYNAAFRPATHDSALEYLKKHAPWNLPKAGERTDDMWSVGTGCYPYRVNPKPGGHSGPGTLGLTTKLFADWWYFTRDERALRTYGWPVIHGAADFLSRCCVETNGLFLSAFSASPEQFSTPGGKWDWRRSQKGEKAPYYHTVGCAFDQQMICENARDLLAVADALGTNDAVVARVRREIAKYDPIQIGASGQIKEYREEQKYGEIGEYCHRHISQLVGLMPGTQITRNEPDYLAAAKVSLTERGDKSTGWALAHRLCSWARLGEGDHAHLLLENLLSERTFPNLWDVHPPFQIDGNFGATAGIAEMLLQSHTGCIDLLPALPKAWAKRGSFRGLCARGAFEVDCDWADGRPTRVAVRSLKGLKPDVRFGGRPCDFVLE